MGIWRFRDSERAYFMYHMWCSGFLCTCTHLKMTVHSRATKRANTKKCGAAQLSTGSSTWFENDSTRNDSNMFQQKVGEKRADSTASDRYTLNWSAEPQIMHCWCIFGTIAKYALQISAKTRLCKALHRCYWVDQTVWNNKKKRHIVSSGDPHLREIIQLK